MGMGGGRYNPLDSPVIRNTGIYVKIAENEYNKRRKTDISDKERKLGYIGIGIFSTLLIGIISLFLIL